MTQEEIDLINVSVLRDTVFVLNKDWDSEYLAHNINEVRMELERRLRGNMGLVGFSNEEIDVYIEVALSSLQSSAGDDFLDILADLTVDYKNPNKYDMLIRAAEGVVRDSERDWDFSFSEGQIKIFVGVLTKLVYYDAY